MEKIDFNNEWLVTSTGTESVVAAYTADQDVSKKRINLLKNFLFLRTNMNSL